MANLIKDPEKALQFTLEQLLPWEGADTWVVPQSGGKDSRAVAQSILVLIKHGLLKPPKRIVFIMADTLMEFWSFIDQARNSMHEMVRVAQGLGIAAEAVFVQPIPQDDFWIRILGYGYAPPSDNMRWCTDKLKIQPMAKMRRAMNIKDAPVFLGVRYGESDRRDKILSCTVGGECGPDAMTKSASIDAHLKVTPIVRWRKCAVWDFLTLIAPIELGVDNQGLVMHYGPDGDLRYGCWSCPLIYNDRTAEHLKQTTPILHELIGWTNAHFRDGGQAWKVENREYFQKQDARLSLAYCQRLFNDLVEIGARHGIELLSHRQREEIQAKWAWRRSVPKAMQGHDMHPTFDLIIERPPAKPLRITAIADKTAFTLARAPLIDDPYHRAIQHGATMLDRYQNKREWVYVGQTGSMATIWSDPESEDKATVAGERIAIDGHTPIIVQERQPWPPN
jgi:DNA sulfur modification protein DndC